MGLGAPPVAVIVVVELDVFAAIAGDPAEVVAAQLLVELRAELLVLSVELLDLLGRLVGDRGSPTAAPHAEPIVDLALAALLGLDFRGKRGAIFCAVIPFV